MKNYTNTILKEIKTSEKYQEHPERLESPEHELGYCDGLKFALDEWKKCDLAQTIARTIRAHLRDNYGESEARQPCYNIRELAQAIANELQNDNK